MTEHRCCGSSLDADHQSGRRTLNNTLLVCIHTAAEYDGEVPPVSTCHSFGKCVRLSSSVRLQTRLLFAFISLSVFCFQ